MTSHPRCPTTACSRPSAAFGSGVALDPDVARRRRLKPGVMRMQPRGEIMNHIRAGRRIIVLLLFLLGFSPGADILMSQPASTIEVKNALPPPGYPVDGDTVIRADIAYQIGDFDSSHGKYVLVPMFDTARYRVKSGATKIPAGHSRSARVAGMAERTPKALAS